MEFKGTIVITDPCYVINKSNYPHPNPTDFNLSYSIINKPFEEYKTPEELAYKAACDKYYKEYREKDDWERSNYGDNMKVLGINHYFTKPTIYGDWNCVTWKVKENPKLIVNNFCSGDPESIMLGNFCADSGLVSVFYLDEIIKYNPEFEQWARKHDWCVTIIPNFDGEVEYYIDENEEAHILGTGNINFLTQMLL